MFNCEDSTIICIDIQEKLVNMLKNPEAIVQNAKKLMKSADILDIDTIVTEQYPKGLGSTIKQIQEIANFKTFEKKAFSVLRDENFKYELKKNIIIFGIETHICVYQTVLDLLDKEHRVFVVCDCCASRSELNYSVSLDAMRQSGAKVVTLEMVLFEFLKSSKHEKFKEVQVLIK